MFFVHAHVVWYREACLEPSFNQSAFIHAHDCLVTLILQSRHSNQGRKPSRKSRNAKGTTFETRATWQERRHVGKGAGGTQGNIKFYKAPTELNAQFIQLQK